MRIFSSGRFLVFDRSVRLPRRPPAVAAGSPAPSTRSSEAGGLRQFVSELGVVGQVQQVGRKLLDDFVNNNQGDSPESNA